MNSTLFGCRTHVMTRRTHFFRCRTGFFIWIPSRSNMNTAAEKWMPPFFVVEFISTTAEVIISLWIRPRNSWIRLYAKWILPFLWWYRTLCYEYVSFWGQKKGNLFFGTLKKELITQIETYSFSLPPNCSKFHEFCTLENEFSVFMVWYSFFVMPISFF